MMLVLRRRFAEPLCFWLLAVVVFSAFAVPNRTQYGPDEAMHFMTVAFYYTQQRMPRADDPAMLLGGQIHQPPLYYALSAVALHGRDRLMAAARSFKPVRSSQQVQPTRLFMKHAEPEKAINRAADQPDRVRFLRFFWIPFNALTIVLTLLTGRMLFPATPAIARTAAILHLFLPQFGFISSVINNDHLANLIVSLVVYETVRVFRSTPPTLHTAIRIGIVSALCFWIKLTALLWVPMLFSALILRSRARLIHVSTSAAIMSAFGAPVWIYNLMVWDHPFAFTILHRFHRILFSPRILTDLSPGFTYKTFFGAFGASAAHRLDPVLYSCYFLILLLAAAGYIRSPVSPDMTDRRDLRWFRFFWLSGIALGVASLIHYSLEMLGGDQGRYLFTGLSAMALLAAEGMYRLSPRSRAALVSTLIASGYIILWFRAYTDVWLPLLPR